METPTHEAHRKQETHHCFNDPPETVFYHLRPQPEGSQQVDPLQSIETRNTLNQQTVTNC